MKNFKDITISIFAVIGFVVIACSAAATADDNPVDNPDIPPIVQSNIGKYQISISNRSANSLFMVSVNTETGVSKTYFKPQNESAWEEDTQAAITFTH
jgi:hypothetical protein